MHLSNQLLMQKGDDYLLFCQALKKRTLQTCSQRSSRKTAWIHRPRSVHPLERTDTSNILSQFLSPYASCSATESFSKNAFCASFSSSVSDTSHLFGTQCQASKSDRSTCSQGTSASMQAYIIPPSPQHQPSLRRSGLSCVQFCVCKAHTGYTTPSGAGPIFALIFSAI